MPYVSSKIDKEATSRVKEFLLKVTDGNSTHASQMLLKVIRRNALIQESIVKDLTKDSSKVESIITDRLNNFVQRIKSSDGANPREQQEALMTILTAVFYGSSNDKDKSGSDRK